MTTPDLEDLDDHTQFVMDDTLGFHYQLQRLWDCYLTPKQRDLVVKTVGPFTWDQVDEDVEASWLADAIEKHTNFYWLEGYVWEFVPDWRIH